MTRVLIASIYHEVNHFSPGVTTIEDFQRLGWALGADSLVRGKGRDQAAGAASVAREEGVDLIPILFAQAGSGPPVTDSAWATIREIVLGAIREHRESLDGIYLSLHGAMATESLTDPEGALLAEVREIVGPDLPVAASFDLHCHFTALMARSADILVGFETCPHVDFFTTGQRAMRLLVRSIRGEPAPVIRYRKLRMTASSEHHDTRRGPMHEVMVRRKELERRPGILDISVFATQPWFDAPEVGWSTVVIAAPDALAPDAAANAQQCADELGEMLWARRERFRVRKTPVDQVLAAVRDGRAGGEERPVVASEGADSTSAGSTGDGVDTLRALVEAGATIDALVPVADPVAAAACFAAGVDATVAMEIGGRLSPGFHRPLRVTGRVATLCDGRYRSKYPPFPTDAGPTAVLAIGAIRLVITSRPAYLLDLELFKRAGLDPVAAELVVVKSAGGYREFYEPIAAQVFDVDTTGPADSDLTRLPFRRLDHPLWPFEADLQQPW